MTEADNAEIVALLVEAYDTMEDLAPDPQFEEPDDELNIWLERTGGLLQRLTGSTARSLVDARYKRATQ